MRGVIHRNMVYSQKLSASLGITALLLGGTAVGLGLWITRLRKGDKNRDEEWDECAIYRGMIQHMRGSKGLMHKFGYPIFFAYMDVDKLPGIVPNSFCGLWRWQDGEHLRNGEGGVGSLGERIRRLVRERTDGRCETDGCKVFLLTNLE